MDEYNAGQFKIDPQFNNRILNKSSNNQYLFNLIILINMLVCEIFNEY